MDNLMKCKECGSLVKTIIPEGQKKCIVCNLNLLLNEFREGHKKCRTCESLKYNEWREKNLDKWKKGGAYYKYISKKKPVENINELEALHDMQDKSD